MATFTFNKIADSSGDFAGFTALSAPAINDQGTVAFNASLDNNNTGIFTGSGGPTTKIADSIENSTGFNSVSSPSINNQGTVAFRTGLDNDNSGIFTGSGGPTTKIADLTTVNDQFGLSSIFLESPSINNQGTVAFASDPGFDGGSGIFTGSGGVINPITVTNEFSIISGDPFINDQGTVVFTQNAKGFAENIYTGNGGPLTLIASTDDSSEPSINNQGTVAFGATALFDIENNIEFENGIFTSSGEQITTIASDSGPFSISLEDGRIAPSLINDEGMVAFLAELDAGGKGIFTGPDPVTDKVIATGDALFGSTVTDVFFSRDGLNNGGQVAFSAVLENGNEVVAVAVPEPGSSIGLLGAVAILGTVRYGWRRLKRVSKIG